MVDVREAVRDGAPQVWPEAPGNIAVDWPGPAPDPDANAQEVERVIASATHVARVSRRPSAHHGRTRWSRAAPPRATMPANDSYMLRCCSQSARALRDGWRRSLGVPKERLRVTTEDVGGAFGLKTGPYPEYLAILVAARKLGRPVHWMSSRAEAFLSDNHARDAVQRGRAGARREGQIPGAARAPPRQHGRLYRRGRRQHPDRQFRALPARHVRHQADRRRRALRVHQHHADRALSRRRPAGGELHPRARDRRGRARHRHRSGQAAPAQPDQAQGDAVQDRGRHHLSTAASSQRSSTRRWRSPTPTASSSAGARPASAASFAASASPACSSMPAACRSKARR